MALTTTPEKVWILQALLGVETLPAALRLRPFVPSTNPSLIVDTDAGPVRVQDTAEYADLMRIGVIDTRGHVDDMVRDWLMVLGRPNRQVLLAIRRPSGDAAYVDERVLVVCQHQRWLVMCARSEDEIVIEPVGRASPGGDVDLIARTLLPAFGHAEAADLDGVNLDADLVQSALTRAVPLGRDAVTRTLAKLGLTPKQAEVLTAVTRLDESALAVVAVIEHGMNIKVHPRVLVVADTEYGRISITTTTGVGDKKKWMSAWPATPLAVRDELYALLRSTQAA